jgi:hypothetical protein
LLPKMGVEPALKMFISQVLASRSAVSADDESDCYEHGGHQFARCWLRARWWRSTSSC